jgi:V/A-type H+-transporting ATPase subunit F
VKKILVVTPAPPVCGFAMAGVMAREAVPIELPRLIDDAVADTSVGVLAIDERVIGRQAQERLREVERRWRGAVVILPSPTAGPEEDYAQRLIRRAIGYQVRVQL